MTIDGATEYRIKTVASLTVALLPVTVLLFGDQTTGALASAFCAVAWPLSLAWLAPTARREKRNWKWHLLLLPLVFWPVTVAAYVFLSWRLGGYRP